MNFRFLRLIGLFLFISWQIIPCEVFASDSFDYVILGAGPAGLTTAIALAQKGEKNILVLEKRIPEEVSHWEQESRIQIWDSLSSSRYWGSRDRNVAIDARALNLLRGIGLNLSYFPINGISFKDGRDRGGYLQFNSFAGNFLKNTIIKRDFAAALSISELEQSLLERALDYPEIKIGFGAEVLISGKDSVRVNSDDEIDFRNLIVASGAKLNSSHEIEYVQQTVPGTKNEDWIVGTFKKDDSDAEWIPGYHFATGLNVENLGFLLAIDKGGDFISVYVNRPKLSPEDALIQSQRVLNVPGELVGFDEFNSHPTEKSVIEGSDSANIFFIGDARYSHDPALGAGVSTAVRSAQILASTANGGRVNHRLFERRIQKVKREWVDQSKWAVQLRTLVKTTSVIMSSVGGFFSNSNPKNQKNQYLSYQKRNRSCQQYFKKNLSD